MASSSARPAPGRELKRENRNDNFTLCKNTAATNFWSPNNYFLCLIQSKTYSMRIHPLILNTFECAYMYNIRVCASYYTDIPQYLYVIDVCRSYYTGIRVSAYVYVIHVCPCNTHTVMPNTVHVFRNVNQKCLTNYRFATRAPSFHEVTY